MTFPTAVQDKAIHTEPNGLFIGDNGQWTRKFDKSFLTTKVIPSNTNPTNDIELVKEANDFIEFNCSFSQKADSNLYITLHNAAGKLLDGVEWSRGVWTADSGNSGQGTVTPASAWGQTILRGIPITPNIGNWRSSKDRFHFLEIKFAPTLSEERSSLGFRLFTTDPAGGPYVVTGTFLFAMHVSWVKRIGFNNDGGINGATINCRYW